MTLYQLKPALLSQGCNENRFAVGEKGSASDAFCIMKTGAEWKVFYTERGCDSPPIFSGTSEEEACAFFYKYILSLEHWHIVGTFSNEAEAINLETQVRALGAKPIRNDISAFNGPGDARYRVFVIGKDIFPVQKGIIGIPISNVRPLST